jgi:hypothetical protein
LAGFLGHHVFHFPCVDHFNHLGHE